MNMHALAKLNENNMGRNTLVKTEIKVKRRLETGITSSFRAISYNFIIGT